MATINWARGIGRIWLALTVLWEIALGLVVAAMVVGLTRGVNNGGPLIAVLVLMALPFALGPLVRWIWRGFISN